MAQPTAPEQELLELMNRMRSNPGAELQILLDSADGNSQYALDYYGVKLTTLRAQWQKLVAAPPLAWSSELHDAALSHNQKTILLKQQAHVLPGELGLYDRIVKANYQPTFYGENVYAAARSVNFAHTGLAIDWGQGLNSIDGIQAPALHRQNMLSPVIREVGISAVADHNSAPIGPLVVTEDFGTRNDLSGKAWLLGVAFQDTDRDGWYDAGEGLSDVKVQITGINGTKFSRGTAIGQAGGYQELLNPGQYRVDFSRNDQQLGSQNTTIATQNPTNVKVDLVVPVMNLGTNLQTQGTEHHVLDFRTDGQEKPISLSNQTIALKFTAVSASATYHNHAGLYRVEDEQGTVIDPIGGKSYQPGDYGYVTAALRRAGVSNESVEFDHHGVAGETKLKGGYIYAPFLVANGRVSDILTAQNSANSPQVYFNYKAANADKIEHIQMLSPNKFGFEDLAGGGDLDYNDLIFQVTSQVV